MKYDKKSSAFKAYIPEIKKFISLGYSHNQIIKFLNEERDLELSMYTFRNYLYRYIQKTQSPDNQPSDSQPSDNQPSDNQPSDNQPSDNQNNSDFSIDKEIKSDIISTTDNQNESVEKKALSLTEKALNYSASETNAKINDKVKDLLRMNKP